MRDVAHSAAPPDQAPYAVAEAVFADAKAYLSSREAQQMSESELERELHRRGQELMRRLLQGHLDQRSPGKVAGPVEGADDVERSPQRVQERHPETSTLTLNRLATAYSESSIVPMRLQRAVSSFSETRNSAAALLQNRSASWLDDDVASTFDTPVAPTNTCASSCANVNIWAALKFAPLTKMSGA